MIASMSVSAQGSSSGTRDGESSRYPPPFDVKTYIWDHRSLLDTAFLFAAFPWGSSCAPMRDRLSRHCSGGMVQAEEALGWVRCVVVVGSFLRRGLAVFAQLWGGRLSASAFFTAHRSALVSQSADCCITWSICFARRLWQLLLWGECFVLGARCLLQILRSWALQYIWRLA